LNFGVGGGFEIPYFLSFDVKKVFNIDPTGDSFLNHYVREWKNAFPDKLEFIDYAISEITNEIEVIRYEGANKITEKFRAIGMEELLKKISLSRLDLVKVDTDGGENSILDGMDILIKKFRPQVVFSIYHTNRDFFEMPIQLMDMCPDYHFYCKTYSYEKHETLLYCIPSEVDK
jgi:FkbM family methyltransferase